MESQGSSGFLYRSWRQVSGYFDGDGNVGLEVAKYILRFRIRFIDTWRPQVEAIRNFLVIRGVATTNICVEKSDGRNDAFRIEVGAVSGVLRAAKCMVPFCVKKEEDLRIAIEYLEDRITGNEAITRFNDEIVSHRRSGYLRELTVPYTRSDGVRGKQLENAAKARAAYAVHVPDETRTRIRQDHSNSGLGYHRLAKKYGYSQSVIRRVLGRP